MTVLAARILTLAATLLGPEPSFPKPVIERVRVVGDTVWFEGTRGFDTESTRYCFVRSTGSWCRLPRPGTDQAHAEPVPRAPRDTIELAAGLRLVCRPGSEWPSSCEVYGILTSDDGRVHWLLPQAERATRLALMREIGLETEVLPEMSTLVRSLAADDRSVWFGLSGGFPEGEGVFGGLIRYDRQLRTVETITHPKLASATVTGLVLDGDALWIGTLHPGEYAPWGLTGILRRDVRGGGWSRVDSAATELPDNLVQALAGADGVLYVATADGLAAFDPRSNRWNVRYFRRTIIADSIVYALATARPADEAGDEAIYVLMQQLGVTRRAAFVAAMQQIGLARLHRVLAPTDDTFAEALAHPTLLPFLVEALDSPSAMALAASALGRIGDRRVLPPMRRALDRATDIHTGATVAASMARLGDAAGLEWLHGRLRPSVPPHARRQVLQALRGVRDTASIGPILAVAARDDSPDDLRQAAVEVLQRYGSPRVWRLLTDSATRVVALRPPVVAGADSIALTDSVVARAVGDWALDLIDRAVEQHGFGAIRQAVRLRPHDAVRSLARVVLSNGPLTPLAAQELVRLTGVGDAPAVDPWSGEGRRAAQEYWSAWWSENAARFVVVPPEVGRRAYDAWYQRIIRQRRAERERRLDRRRDG